MGDVATEIVHVPSEWTSRHPAKPHISGLLEYQALYKESSCSSSTFWAQQARDLLTFTRDFHTTSVGSFENGDTAWFVGGQLNACFNCVDRHAMQDPEKTAIIYELDDPASSSRVISYGELLVQVSRLAGCLRAHGVKKGDIVTIYMPVVPEAVVAILACARIGAIHSVVFAGFSAEALRDRLIDANSTLIITSDEGRRGGRTFATKQIVDDAVRECSEISTVLVYKRTGAEVPWTPGRDLNLDDELKKYPTYTPPTPMDSEDFLFLLYTSGSTGKPKGVLHSTAGYLLGAAITAKNVFDLHPQDRFFCAGDIGWITGHTYVVYGPLALGSATIIFEGTPNHPNPTRIWQIIEKHKATHFYAAPTMLRLLKRLVEKAHLAGIDTNQLRVLGSVGEPIAPETWKWYYDYVGKEQAYITDTYWQTETGSHIIAAYAGVTPMKPGSACLPCLGIKPAIIDPLTGVELKGNHVEGALAIKEPWPSLARTIRGDHSRYMDAYFNIYKGYYFTGDGAYRDRDGYYWIRGRLDDVINVSGHRLSTSEIEGVLIEHGSVAEAAVVGVPDEITGLAINAIVSLKTSETHENIEKDLVLKIRQTIGPFAAPKRVVVVRDLPKTRSGKIVRRILRKILTGETDFGDISTLADPTVVEKTMNVVAENKTF